MTEAAAGKGTTDPSKDDAAAAAAATQKAADDKAAADKKTADDTAAAAKKKTDDDAAEAAAKAKKAPEKYELKVPDDAKDWIDANDLTAIEGLARAKGWTQEEAQGAVTEHAAGLVAQSKRFRAETEADKTYGGDNLAETSRLAALALDKIRPADSAQGKALRGMLAKTGYGNNLLVVSLLADIGKMMDEDSTRLTSGGRKTAGDDPAEKLYGKTAT